MLNVMVSQTWSWFHAQLDFPKSKRIKVHVLRPNEARSYCGLQNNDDVGEMTWEQFVGLGEDACTKCRHLTQCTRTMSMTLVISKFWSVIFG